MNYEEKYKEALERAKKFEEKYGGDYAGYIFPELAESEDERIRRKMVEHFKSKTKETWCNMPVKDIIAYLEKQKENPKSADSIPSDCTSDAKCEDRDSEYVVFPEDALVVARACEKLEAHGYPELADALINVNLYTKEQKPADLSEMMVHKEPYIAPVPTPMVADEQKPAEKHDLVAQLKGHLANATKEQLEAEWKELEKWNDVGPTVEEYLGGIKPAEYIKRNSKEWYSLLAEQYDKGFWKGKAEQKPAEWSEEDEEMLQSIIKDFRAGKVSTIGQEQWLKSLHPSWKPSEEQMKALLNAEGFLRAGLQHDSAKTIAELYEQLKKL